MKKIDDLIKLVKNKCKELLEFENKNTKPSLKIRMEIYSLIPIIADSGDRESFILYSCHSSFIQNFIEKSLDILKNANDNNFFDIFFKQTKRIFFISYELSKAFIYLDRYFTNGNIYYPLNKNGLELYKNFFLFPQKINF